MAERKSFLIHIDAQTLDLVKEWADDEFRSLNGHVEFLLRDALKRSGRLKSPAGKSAKAARLSRSSMEASSFGIYKQRRYDLHLNI